MLVEDLKFILERDLKKLKLEIGLYQDESKIWIVDK